MNILKYIFPGVLFGVVLTKAEVVSWFRIQEIFRFESFHMYGIIGTAVILGAIITFTIKKMKAQDIQGEKISFKQKDLTIYRYLFGGVIFGLGWAMSGACPGPMFVLVGHGVWSILLVILSAVAGTYFYGAIRSKLPH